MATVKVLIEGFTNADQSHNDKECTKATISLVRDQDLVIVCDPGVLDSQDELVRALKKENLSVHDLTHVFLTHSHIDHYRNTGMFPTAKVVEYYGVWDGTAVEDRPKKLSNNIEILETPGHNVTSLTLLVQTEQGKVAVCGDVFWKENEPVEDEYADDMPLLKETRTNLLEIADFIVPGHANIYKVKK